MEAHTLVLSNTYEPVARVPWQRAITLLFEGKVEVVEEYENKTVRSITMTFKVPSIIRFLKYVRRRKPSVKFSRESVYTRDKGCCQYCRRPVKRHEATYDHVLPRSRGGQTTWENVVIACTPCNQKKRDRTPAEAGMHLRVQPVKPASLPETRSFSFLFDRNAPPSWRQFAASYAYWNTELDP
jgi:5-methylcytosine-specific restriction endonuclease McrA